MTDDRGPYYAIRVGALTPRNDLDWLKRSLLKTFRDLEEQGFFQVHFGYYCIDADYVPGSLGRDPAEEVYLRTHVDLWPLHVRLADLDEAGTLTAIEFLHDHCAKPIKSQYHSYNQCGIHVDAGDDEAGRAVFRERVRRPLSQYGRGFVLTENGEIWAAPPYGVPDAQPADTGDAAIDGRIASATSRFSRHGASVDDKRHAIRDLADILESLREGIGTQLPRWDENRLFEIANKFGIRHLNAAQRTDYDQELWLGWIYRSFLNSIDVTTALLRRNEQYEQTRCPACHQLTLVDDSYGERDSDGALFGGNFKACTNCQWTSL